MILGPDELWMLSLDEGELLERREEIERESRIITAILGRRKTPPEMRSDSAIAAALDAVRKSPCTAADLLRIGRTRATAHRLVQAGLIIATGRGVYEVFDLPRGDK